MRSALIASSIVAAHASSLPAYSPHTTALCDEACSVLQERFGSYVTSGNENFTIWDEKQQEVVPACRVQPANASEVAETLSILVDHWCRFAVKGGGHGRNRDDSNSVGGVTIDLGRIVGVEVAPDAASARIGGGANLEQAFGALEPYNIAFTGGRVTTVGVGGFTLGGGTSSFSNRYGWALDNVLEYEVVLANSSIVTVNEQSHPDLYFALRGGGNNFGIVTAYTFETFPQGPIFSGSVVWSGNQSEAVLDAAYNLFTDPVLSSDLDAGLDLITSYSPATDSYMMIGSQHYSQPIMNASVFSGLNDVPSVSNSGSISNITASLSDPVLGTQRHVFGTLSFSPSRPLMSQAVRILNEEARAIRNVTGLAPNIVIYPLHVNAIQQMKKRGGNALGIDRDEPLFILLCTTEYADPAGDQAVSSMTTNVISRVRAAAQELGVLNEFMYIGYSQSSDQADLIFAGYGAENHQRLISIRKEVDPEGIFTSKGLWTGFMKLL